MNLMELKRSIGLALGTIAPEPEDEAGKEKAKDKWITTPNRAMMRAVQNNHRHVPASEFRPGTVAHSMASKHQRKRRTGAPRHVQAWKHADQVKQHLKAVRTATLAEQIEDKAVASAFALLVDFTPTVWDIAKSSKAALLKVPGMGPVNLKRVHSYLASKNVPLDWSVA